MVTRQSRSKLPTSVVKMCCFCGRGVRQLRGLLQRWLCSKSRVRLLTALARNWPRTATGLVLRALMAFADEPKPGAKEALATLRPHGIKTVVISGDNCGAAVARARRLGMRPEAGEVMAKVLPGEKVAMRSVSVMSNTLLLKRWKPK